MSPIHIAQQCGTLATYRRVSFPSASTICKCITTCRSGGRRAGLEPGYILQAQVTESGRQRAQDGERGSKEKPRLPKGTGLEFDRGETLEVSCLTHHPNPQRRIRFRRRTWPARDRTTA